ncbi:MAG: 1,2-phenylacetyl-CoA epoxidase subunit PaaD [Phycisphaerae bacterium]
MSVTQAILDALRTIDDPEMPISIVDLGIVEDTRFDPSTRQVDIDLLPTFVGCPALPMLEQLITEKIGGLDGIDRVNVHFIFDPPWTVDRITETGRASLKKIGVTVPSRRDSEPTQDLVQINPPPTCPFCNATDVLLTSPFGPTRCRMIYHCNACKNAFEHIKRV